MRIKLILLFMYVAFTSFAGRRTAEEALEIAKKQFISFSEGKEKVKTQNDAPQLIYTENLNNPDSIPLFYIFNQQQEKGFVIVSAEDMTIDILAYSNSGSFQTEYVPPALQYWLNEYRKNIISIKSKVNQYTGTKHENLAENQSFVSPLLGAVKWNQTAPYNDMCPEINATTKEKAATGCVATGMAQVMKYHQWPDYGWGIEKYTTKTLKLPVNANLTFVKYDWDNMTNTYGKGSSDEQIKAVAELMFHCGVAVEMDYDKSSAASTVKMGKAFVDNFGYDDDIQLIQRDYYSREEWLQIIKNELNVSRPILYSASDIDDSGHLFVCDGYDENDYLHFNWGWSGLSDGYFYVFDLKPPAGDTGAGNGDGYYYNQIITVGIQKPDFKKNSQYSIYMQQPFTVLSSTIKRDAGFNLTMNKTYNMGLNTFSGKIGLALYKDNRLVSVIESLKVSDLETYYGYSELKYEDIRIPSFISEGNYVIYPVFKPNNQTGWSIIRGRNGFQNYFETEVKSDSIKIKAVNVLKSDLQISECRISGNIYQNKSARFSVKVQNDGLVEYYSNIKVLLQSTEQDTINQIVAATRINLLPGETGEFSLKGNVELAPGSYILKVMYDKANDPENEKVTASSISKPVNIMKEPSGIPNLSIVGKIAFQDISNVFQNDVKLKATIRNTGGYFDDHIIAFVFPETGGSSLAHFGYQTLKIDSLETIEVEFKGDMYINPATYKVAIYQMIKDEWKRLLSNETSVLSFKLQKSDPLNQSLPADYFYVTPNPAKDIINIETNISPQRIFIYSLNGVEMINFECWNQDMPELNIAKLNAGLYLIKITDSAGKILTGKFLKN